MKRGARTGEGSPGSEVVGEDMEGLWGPGGVVMCALRREAINGTVDRCDFGRVPCRWEG